MTFGEISSLNWINYLAKSNGQFNTMTGNRKRSRDDETCEFMPLSKRINNLHINNSLGGASASQTADPSQLNGMAHSHNMSQPHHEPNIDTRPNYDPGPNSSHSPYFNDNKLLFELHLERVERTGQQFPF